MLQAYKFQHGECVGVNLIHVQDQSIWELKLSFNPLVKGLHPRVGFIPSVDVRHEEKLMFYMNNILPSDGYSLGRISVEYMTHCMTVWRVELISDFEYFETVYDSGEGESCT